MANGLLALLSALNGYGQGNLWRQKENERQAEERAAQAKGSRPTPAPKRPLVPNSTTAVPNAPGDTALGDRLAREIVPPPYHHHVFQDMFAPLPSRGPLWQEDGQSDSQDGWGQPSPFKPATPLIPSLPPMPDFNSGRFMPLVPPVSPSAIQAAMPSPSSGLRTAPGLAPPWAQPASRVAAGDSPPARNASGLPAQSGQATFLHQGRPVTYTVTA